MSPFPAPPALAAVEGDHVLRDFRFNSGESLAELRIHYRTLGRPNRDAAGRVTNAVLLLHGTGGSGETLLNGEFAEILFRPGGLLDPARHYLILPDAIGHGDSSKPSDGLRMKFPAYDYDDMVRAQHAVVTDALGVGSLRLLLGTSMGGMHAFLWAQAWPEFAAAVMPIACGPGPIVGRNRLHRVLSIMAIKADPTWGGGGYAEQPIGGLTGATAIALLANAAPIRAQKDGQTPDAIDAKAAADVAAVAADLDANDFIYQRDASRNYDASAGLEAVEAHVMWVNTADDFSNPPELGQAEADVKRIRKGRFVLIPGGEATNGHLACYMPSVWGGYLAELLRETEVGERP